MKIRIQHIFWRKLQSRLVNIKVFFKSILEIAFIGLTAILLSTSSLPSGDGPQMPLEQFIRTTLITLRSFLREELPGSRRCRFGFTSHQS